MVWGVIVLIVAAIPIALRVNAPVPGAKAR
jgi:hypothetical protein